jgi:hypothetical protein
LPSTGTPASSVEPVQPSEQPHAEVTKSLANFFHKHGGSRDWMDIRSILQRTAEPDGKLYGTFPRADADFVVEFRNLLKTKLQA